MENFDGSQTVRNRLMSSNSLCRNRYWVIRIPPVHFICSAMHVITPWEPFVSQNYDQDRERVIASSGGAFTNSEIASYSVSKKELAAIIYGPSSSPSYLRRQYLCHNKCTLSEISIFESCSEKSIGSLGGIFGMLAL